MKTIAQHLGILFLTGCSCFSPEQPAAPVVQPKAPVVQKKAPVSKAPPPETCEQSCEDKGGLKKTFCMKKCQSKHRKEEKQALLKKTKPDEKKTR